MLNDDASMLKQSLWWAAVHLQPLLLKATAVVAAALSAVIVWGEIVSGVNSKLSPLHVLVRASQNQFVSQVKILPEMLSKLMPFCYAFVIVL